MSRIVVAMTLVAGLLGGLAVPALAQDDAYSGEEIQTAVSKAHEYLWSQWDPEAMWEKAAKPDYDMPYPHSLETKGRQWAGRTALCAYALLASGHSPQEERMAKTLDWLVKQKMFKTYALTMRIAALSHAGAKYDGQMRRDVRQLFQSVDVPQRGQHPGSYGYWSYGKPDTTDYDWRDMSNSQMAVLGAWIGSMRGVEIPKKYWQLVWDFWLAQQQDGGGWYYYLGQDKAHGTMTAAGVATLYICFDELYGREFVRCGRGMTPEPIKKGIDWMASRLANTSLDSKEPFFPMGHPMYFLYTLERFGKATGRKYFGTTDWYRQGLAKIMKDRRENGQLAREFDETCFALLYLARGLHPVVFNHLEYEGSWQNRPRALAELTEYVSTNYEKNIRWQIVNFPAGPEDWHDAPVLYISGHEDPRFTPEQVEKLKTFVLQGGRILSIAECDGAEFTKAMMDLYAAMFPQYEMASIGREHALYTVRPNVVRRQYPISALSNGVRDLAFHVEHDLPLSWQLRKRATAASDYDVMANLYLLVSDRGVLPARGENVWPKLTRTNTTRTIKVARLKHAGNADPEPYAWQRFGIRLQNDLGVKVETEQIDITALKADAYPLAHMTGTAAVQLTSEQRDAIKAYGQGGGVLFIDAAGGSNAFAKSMSQMLETTFGKDSLRRLPVDSPIYTRKETPVTEVRYRTSGAGASPKLDAVRIGDELRVIFSAEDLTLGMLGVQAYGVEGYAPALDPQQDTAYKLVRNIVLFAADE